MEDFLEIIRISIVVIIVGFAFIFSMAWACLIFESGTYEYIDLDGDKGTAKICFKDDSLSCKTSDDKTILVKEYKKIK